MGKVCSKFSSQANKYRLDEGNTSAIDLREVAFELTFMALRVFALKKVQ